MTPAAFIKKWTESALRERQGSQEHFIDLCRLLGEPTPAEADPLGVSYCFERGATKVGGGDGWADVWRRGCFGWEYKGKHKDLNAALRQLQIYAPDLENPPYLVVCDMERIIVHTNWTNAIRKTFTFGFDELREPAKLDQLRLVFRGSDELKPGLSPQALTQIVAERFGDLGKRLQERGHDPRAVAHFLNRVIFCLFAEDADLLPSGLFTRMLRNVSYEQYNIPKKTKAQFDALFAMMKEGGFFGADAIRWFNGGLFDEAEALPLERDDLDMLIKTAREHDWSNLDPAILGTMFETALKTTGRRAALGAHYTDREKILKIVDPVIIRPLAAEWETALAAIRAETDAMKEVENRRQKLEEDAATILAEQGAEVWQKGEAKRRKERAGLLRERDEALGRATAIRDAYVERLAKFRVLDPACGSGNFLYVALHALRDLELRALVDADRLGVPQVRPKVGLDAIRGIEIEPYAAELARVTLWIGNLQWDRRNGFRDPPEPVLSKLDTIECRDALLNKDGSEAEWPEAEVIIGNPPFLGGKRLRDGLGDDYVERLFAAYKGKVPAEADFVCYWVAKAWGSVWDGEGGPVRAGLVATNSIRQGASRRILESIANEERIFDAWADEPWTLEGAAVRVSMVCMGEGLSETRLNGLAVRRINADLTSFQTDFTKVSTLGDNKRVAFIGDQKGGPFEVEGQLARVWLKMPLNPNGRSNSEVLRPWMNGGDLTDRPSDRWIIDFGQSMSLEDASLYQAPFERIKASVTSNTRSQREVHSAKKWWLHQRPRPEMRRATACLRRQLVTPRVSKHRFFVWRHPSILADSRLVCVTRSEDVWLGLLSSRFHEKWSLATASWHGVGNDPTYNAESCFETFPFPEGLTPNLPAESYAGDPRAKAIAEVAEELNRLREAWLNPPDLVRIEPEVVPGYPDRILPKDEEAAKILKKRTLTNLYNERPAWLDNVHKRLDAAVAAAYGWPADLPDEEILARLFALNQERAAQGR